jgi:hypothetical protein
MKKLLIALAATVALVGPGTAQSITTQLFDEQGNRIGMVTQTGKTMMFYDARGNKTGSSNAAEVRQKVIPGLRGEWCPAGEFYVRRQGKPCIDGFKITATTLETFSGDVCKLTMSHRGHAEFFCKHEDGDPGVKVTVGGSSVNGKPVLYSPDPDDAP